MFDFRVFNDDRDCRLAASDPAYPHGIPEGCRVTRDGFVEAICTDLDSMLDAINVAATDSAGAKRHA